MFLGSTNAQPSTTALPEDLTYTIEDVHIIPGIKRSLDIRLSRPVSKDVLQSLAMKLKNSDRGTYQRTFITYWLPGTKIGSGAWATTHFDPNLVVRVYGLLPNDKKMIQTALSSGAGHSRILIGRWLDETPFAVIPGISLYRENGILYMERKFKDGSGGRSEMVKLGQRFKEKEHLDSGDYWLIDRQGNLQLRDQEGLISTAKRLQ